jgi:hypothetical protein
MPSDQRRLSPATMIYCSFGTDPFVGFDYSSERTLFLCPVPKNMSFSQELLDFTQLLDIIVVNNKEDISSLWFSL